MGIRHRGRQRAVQCLYQWQLTGAPLERILERFWRAQEESPEVREFAEELARGVVADADRLDRLIDEQARNWRLDRMGVVERNILRLGVHELTGPSDTPTAVAIDEAIELAKRFGGEGAGQFVNGILDGIRRRLDSEEMETSSQAGSGGRAEVRGGTDETG